MSEPTTDDAVPTVTRTTATERTRVQSALRTALATVRTQLGDNAAPELSLNPVDADAAMLLAMTAAAGVRITRHERMRVRGRTVAVVELTGTDGVVTQRWAMTEADAVAAALDTALAGRAP